MSETIQISPEIYQLLKRQAETLQSTPARVEVVLALASRQSRILLTSNAQDFAPLVAEWFLAGREHGSVIIVPGQTNRNLLSRALANIVKNYTAESFKNTYRFIQDFV